MFTISGGQTFWQSFSDQVIHFKELTKDMPEEKMFSLMADPSRPGKNNHFYYPTSRFHEKMISGVSGLLKFASE